ncbi:amidohydrolase 2 [Aspergillus pseudodeflectus]|uniref:Amidohydrolase 2 n=1 Tax=Aspergillus pseudodeflectus TaxID=176178 RepID=A0ABR4L459_9EURO
MAILMLTALHTLAAHCLSPNYRIDVHSHAIPDIWRQALLDAGYPIVNGTLTVEGFPVPEWTLDDHIDTMNKLGVGYATLSITAPGVYFLAEQPGKAKKLAREINEALHEYTQKYPTRLGALCLLPLPSVEDALAEIEYCLDTLHFDGVALYTNSAGLYLGSESLDPIFEALTTRNATVFVHPAEPGCHDATMGYPAPLTEYPFDSVRAMQNMLLTGQRARYPNVTIIYPHGGGAIPYLANRIASVSALDVLGGLNPLETMQELKGYYFDTASSTSKVQLGALKEFAGVEKILVGTDYPYVPASGVKLGLEVLQRNGEFTDVDIVRLNHGNALSNFPRIMAKLNHHRPA